MNPRAEPASERPRHRREDRICAALLALVVASFLAPLLPPDRALAVRDMASLHLPLRSSWATLAARGGTLFPEWDPYLLGGQPLLSNPQYGALYPPNWIALATSPARAIAWLAILHAFLAAFGARALARRLGCDPATSALAGVAWACGPLFLALLHTFPLALGMSWLPWFLAFLFDRLEAGGRPPRERSTSGLPAIGCALSLAGLILAAGEPALLLAALVAAALLFAFHEAPLRPKFLAVAPAAALGSGLAAILLVPGLARLAGSGRGAGLPLEQALQWSFPWRRLPELILPWLYGDASRPADRLFFGGSVNDRAFPFLLTLAIGWPLVVCGFAFFARASRHRNWLAGCLAIGIFFALGRHNPALVLTLGAARGLAVLRYPEKFLLLSLAALLVAGVLGWGRLLDDRGSRRTALRAEVWIASGLLAVALAIWIGARLAPESVASFVTNHAGMPLDERALASAVAFALGATSLSVGIACATLLLFGAATSTRVPRLALQTAMFLLVAGELALTARPFLVALPADRWLARPAALPDLAAGAAPQRLFSPERGEDRDVLVVGEPALAWARGPIAALAPRSANLYGRAYVLDFDFDFSATPAAQRAQALARRFGDERELALRLLRAWSVDRIVVRRDPRAMVAEVRAGRSDVARVDLAPLAETLPSARSVDSYRVFSDATAAEDAAIAAELPFDREEFLIGAPAPPNGLARAAILADDDRGDRRRIAYDATGPTLVVVASTFDPRWTARVDEEVVPVFETAAGYQAMLLPAGRRTVELVFRDPWFPVGASISAVSALVALLRFARRRGAGISGDLRSGLVASSAATDDTGEPGAPA